MESMEKKFLNRGWTKALSHKSSNQSILTLFCDNNKKPSQTEVLYFKTEMITGVKTAQHEVQIMFSHGGYSHPQPINSFLKSSPLWIPRHGSRKPTMPLSTNQTLHYCH